MLLVLGVRASEEKDSGDENGFSTNVPVKKGPRARQNCNWLSRICTMNMRIATCVSTETSKVPTRVTLLFISYSVTGRSMSNHIYRQKYAKVTFMNKLI